VIRIMISAAAYSAISGEEPPPQVRAPNGDCYLWVFRAQLDQLRALREPGEDYSAVILRLAAAGELRSL
jgi:hypothetical protein